MKSVYAATMIMAVTVSCSTTEPPPPLHYPEAQQPAADDATTRPAPLPRPVHPSADRPPGFGLEKTN